MIVEAPTTIHTERVPLVDRWDEPDGPVYVVTFDDAAVSVRLTEEQIRGLGARILSATLDELEDDDLA